MKTLPSFWFESAPWIDGAWERPRDPFAVRNPATGAALAGVGRADEATVARAVEGAARAFPAWRDTPAATLEALRRRRSKVQSWYLDLTMIEKYWGAERVYHHTAPISMSYCCLGRSTCNCGITSTTHPCWSTSTGWV